MGGAEVAWDALQPAWRACFEEAWISWSEGSAGVGAAVADADGTVVSTGRNRILGDRTVPGLLAGTSLAHAEMNALAVLPLGRYGDHALYTTFEPCLMCASTITQFGMGTVAYAAADPFFDGLHDWLGALPFAAARLPRRQLLGGPIGAFGHVLHLSWLSFWVKEGEVVEAHHRLTPKHLELARTVADDDRLGAAAGRGSTVVEVLDDLWGDLSALAT